MQNEEDDLYAMIKFLHCEPFDELKLWKNQVGNKTKVGRERLKSLVSCFVLRRLFIELIYVQSIELQSLERFLNCVFQTNQL